MKRTRVLAAKTALATSVLALGLAGCSVLNPAVIKDPYPASDGIDADLPGQGRSSTVLLRNLMVIGAEKGGEAELIGSVINRGTTDARVQLQAAVGETGQPSQTTVAVPAGSSVQLGPGANQTPVSISSLAVDPGALTGLTASTTNGGRIDLSLPVRLPEGDYATVTPAAEPSPSATTRPRNGNGNGNNSGSSETTESTGAGASPDASVSPAVEESETAN
ncbi:hypothetical protein [Kineosporia succinea]|uniref:Copper(I)-binding protein n=1 Tax=Kineosporia succinea TaxID=84632 RepID=A0ABT9P2U7_9ACTN|nr:hypothetical protein [Kineosporia succinea]MDP9827007.1 hypothetical protein [Kineosporia succinea]